MYDITRAGSLALISSVSSAVSLSILCVCVCVCTSFFNLSVVIGSSNTGARLTPKYSVQTTVTQCLVLKGSGYNFFCV